jgi:putative toxin-antitoxin system antitoxin component (TIGR02293 family)
MSIKALNKILNDTVELIHLTRKGVEYSLFNSIVLTTPYSIKDWSTFLHLTERTLQRYKKEDKSFEQPYSERILEIAQLHKKGAEVFGNTDFFNQWLDSNIVALGGIKPKSLLDSSFGITVLNQELTRIEHGVLA